jgi:thioredoxin domain-containing protein 5
VEKYQGQRTGEDLKAFVIHKLGSSDSVPTEGTEDPERSSLVVSYSGDNFEHGISTGISFTKFFAPW